jgi:hypothetical protein
VELGPLDPGLLSARIPDPVQPVRVVEVFPSELAKRNASVSRAYMGEAIQTRIRTSPQPRLTIAGAPSGCTTCHADQLFPGRNVQSSKCPGRHVEERIVWELLLSSVV